MPYVPNNPNIFVAAYAGAIAGMGVSGRNPTDQNPANYTGLASLAGAFAEQFDTNWGLNPSDSLQVESTFEACEGFWQERSPNAISPFLNPIEYDGETKTIIAIIQAGGAYFASIGVVPPPFGGGAGP